MLNLYISYIISFLLFLYNILIKIYPITPLLSLYFKKYDVLYKNLIKLIKKIKYYTYYITLNNN